MARKNSIFSGKKNSPKKQAALVAEVQRNHEKAIRQQQRREMNRLAKEVIGLQASVFDLDRESLIQAAIKAQNVLDWRAQQQADFGFKTKTVEYYEKFRRDRTITSDTKMHDRSIQAVLNTYIKQLQSRDTLKVGAKKAKSEFLSQTRDYLGLKRVTLKQAAPLWKALDNARRALSGATWTENDEEYKEIQELIQAAVDDWRSLPKKFRTIEALQEFIENSVINMEEPITPEYYASALKEYQRYHPKFQGPLTREQVQRYGHSVERI